MQTTSIYCLIHYLERKWGIWFPKGGTGELVKALVKLSEEVGIKFELNSQVDKVLVENGRACGIQFSNGEKRNSHLVAFDADPPKVYRKLIDSTHRMKWTDSKLDNLAYSMGLFQEASKVMVLTRKLFLLHNSTAIFLKILFSSMLKLSLIMNWGQNCEYLITHCKFKQLFSIKIEKMLKLSNPFSTLMIFPLMTTLITPKLVVSALKLKPYT